MNDLARLAAGVMITGFDATALDERDVQRLRRTPFAGFILFARNVESVAQVRELTDVVRAFDDPPQLLSIDQEGGRVARIRDGAEELPAMMALGATRDPSLAVRAGEQLAFDLRRAGLSHDFAPVVDLALDPRNGAIGARAFGESPALVIEMAGAFLRGLQRGGVAGTLKHFPGHGDTSVDSHLDLPVIDVDAATLRVRDLAPFAALAPEAASIMAAHVVAAGFDEAVPATLSRRLLTDLLRSEWHYDGVCFTDCMQMNAVANGIGTVKGVAAAIAAGADCAIVSHDLELAEAAAQHLASEVEAGRIPRERLHEAFERVMRLRRATPEPLALDAPAPHPRIGREIARRAVTRIRGIAHADPTASIVVSFSGATTEGAQGTLGGGASLASQAPALQELLAPLDPSDGDAGPLIESIAQSRRRPIVLMRRAHLIPAQARAVAAILERFPDALVVSMREPYDCELFPQAQHLLAAYGDNGASLGGLADVIFGDGLATGVLPVDLARL
ncbi:MAG: beta-N-acetylhexosaminidase [Candidatus Eremiobacteraeota bacterium]|nr:beta-N-acetylhexosaminidase [Candidatus Eremiobacteraeota bacterium]